MQNETGSYPLLYFCPLFENITTSIPGHLFSDITYIRPIYHQKTEFPSMVEEILATELRKSWKYVQGLN